MGVFSCSPRTPLFSKPEMTSNVRLTFKATKKGTSNVKHQLRFNLTVDLQLFGIRDGAGCCFEFSRRSATDRYHSCSDEYVAFEEYRSSCQGDEQQGSDSLLPDGDSPRAFCLDDEDSSRTTAVISRPADDRNGVICRPTACESDPEYQSLAQSLHNRRTLVFQFSVLLKMRKQARRRQHVGPFACDPLKGVCGAGGSRTTSGFSANILRHNETPF